MIRITTYGLAALLAGFIQASSADDATTEPVLLKLGYGAGSETTPIDVLVKGGVVFSPDKGKPRARWTIGAGDTYPADTRPGDRLVNFYKTTNGESALLFKVKVRYFQNPAKQWVPRFQLNEEPLVMRGPDGKWKPLTVIQGVPSLIVQSGSALPNAEGYTAALELGFTTGTMPIDAWLVQ